LISPAQRLSKIPPYAFAELGAAKRELVAQGAELIDLGVGDPDQPTPDHIVEALIAEAGRPANHRYPDYEGSPEFRAAVCAYYQRRFGVQLDPDKESVALIGSKEGLSHLIWAMVDPGDLVLAPDPAYPVYSSQTLLAGGFPHPMPLLAEHGFMPDLDAIPQAAAAKAKIMFINYPNNPTAAVATLAFFRRAVEFAHRHGILICHDAAYAEMTYDGYVAPSILEVEGAREVAVEAYSLSKPFNMTGWRIGAMVGNATAIEALKQIKNNTDSGQFTAVQMAGAVALAQSPEVFFGQMNEMYRERRDALVQGLTSLGLRPAKTLGTFYVWCPVPAGQTSAGFSSKLLREAHVVSVPGSAFGAGGEGYVRFALTVDAATMRRAAERMRELKV
jgi:LL-diaminopimelate aminotransferase